MKRRPSDRVLRRWLSTGRPQRLGRAVASDPELGARLDALTALDHDHAEALHHLVRPASGFEERTTVGVKTRIDGYGTASTLVDLLGLGFHVGRAFGSNSAGATPDDSSVTGWPNQSGNPDESF